jgi:hypothetical protein
MREGFLIKMVLKVGYDVESFPPAVDCLEAGLVGRPTGAAILKPNLSAQTRAASFQVIKGHGIGTSGKT